MGKVSVMEYVKTHPRYLELSDYERKRIDRLNANSKGSVDDCPLCHGRRYIYITDTLSCKCDCKAKADSIKNLKYSGLTEQMQNMTMDKFIAKHEWQKNIKESAMRFLDDANGDWFYIGGQVGAGKTMICSAMLMETIGKGKRAKYMVWPDEVDEIKGNAEDFSIKLDKLMQVEVLYIDDFLKTQKEKRMINGTLKTFIKSPTPGEMNAAFKLINYRYNRPDKITIFSSEFFIDDIMDLDQGLASRIYEKTKSYRLEIGKDDAKNIRLNSI